ncbi:MAG: polyphosphate kinase 2 family protein [Gemmatimonadales bacterium]|nr:MAG: polyphosphate kinase 2 family protein [Gemmatimonadales bacterium]
MERYRIPPDTLVSLADRDPSDRLTFDGKKKPGREYLRELTLRLRELQELLYAEGKHRVLMVLQATDTGGKDGVIRHVFRTVNPQGVKVASFKAPSSRELGHDYLWRIHQETPARGEIRIFNRSHYEDVLIVRVRNLVPEETWERRYQHINDFERMLADEGTTIVKFYLHISKEEQAARLQSRLDDPAKHWKFSPDDLEERKHWDAYREAFEAMLSRTSTPWAPWYAVPSNSKWYRNLVIARVMVDTLEGLDMQFPEPDFDPSEIRVV